MPSPLRMHSAQSCLTRQLIAHGWRDTIFDLFSGCRKNSHGFYTL